MGNEVVPFSEAYQKDRLTLREVVPLAVPLCVCIEPTNICNFKCLMCWQSTKEYTKHGGPFGNMTDELFDKLLEDMKEFCSHQGRKIKLIKLYSTGEPLLHKGICRMVKKIKEADICNEMEITTNASLMTKEMAEAFVDLGLDYLRASIYSVRQDGQSRITQSRVTPHEIRENIAYLKKYRDEKGAKKPFICAKIMDTHGEENEEFFRMYEDVSDEQLIDTPWNLPKTEENALDRLYGGEEGGEEAQAAYLAQAIYKERKVCRYPFTHMTVRSNGDVVVCCTDWSRDTLVGSISDNTLEETWNSKKLYDFRCMQLKTKGAHHALCATCELPLKDTSEDDLDDFPVEKLHYWGEGDGKKSVSK